MEDAGCIHIQLLRKLEMSLNISHYIIFFDNMYSSYIFFE
jgi:hypothetical protein